jgi:hypothetical protein
MTAISTNEKTHEGPCGRQGTIAEGMGDPDISSGYGGKGLFLSITLAENEINSLMRHGYNHTLSGG